MREFNGLNLWIDRRVGTLAILLGVLFFSIKGSAASVREKLPSELRTNGKTTLAAVAELNSVVKAVTVSVLDGEEVVALGTKLSADGWIVTKASELGWQTAVRFENGDEIVPTRVVVNDENDIALMKLDRSLKNVPNGRVPRTFARGTLLVSPASTSQRLKIGIVSADRREVERVGGALGVLLGRDGVSVGGVQVQKVYEDTAAEGAGIKQGDVINSVNGTVVLLREQVIKEVAANNPGENVEIALRRGEMPLVLDVVLGFRSTYFGQLDRNQQLSGKTSTRLTGFEEILQHDIPIDVEAMGGPLMDLSGNIVGVNIACADRVSTYALPIELVHRVFRDLGLATKE